jgi:hypothetical protein
MKIICRVLILVLLTLPVLLTGRVSAQAARPASQDWAHGTVQHHGTSATVMANHDHALRQAIEAVREEYEWVVDYEDPPFQSERDFVDITKPEWRAAHPGQRGQRLLAGSAFQSEYAEPPNTATSTVEQERVLNKIVADYNSSRNPGKYRAVKEPGGRFAVIGEYVKNDYGSDEKVSPILDTPISIPVQTRGTLEMLYLIVEQLSAKTGIKFGYVNWDNSPFRSRVRLGGENVTARSLILRALASRGRLGLIDLRFNPLLGNEFHLLTPVASISSIDASGNRTVFSIDRMHPVNPRGQQ